MPNHKKPTALHVLNGNPSKIKDLGKGEPKPNLGAKPPLWLDEDARAEWDRLAPRMERIGLLTELDEMVFANICQLHSDSLRYRKVLAEEGDTYIHKNVKGEKNEVTRAQAILLHKSLKLLKSLCVEMGLTVSARSRIQLPGEKEDNDVITKLMNKRKGNV